MEIKFIGPVLLVKDIQAARRFYEGVLEQKVALDFGVNVGYASGLALWQREHAIAVIFQKSSESQESRHHQAELCFETAQIAECCERLKESGVELIHPLTEQPWGQRTVRFYDEDGHMIEVAEPMPAVVERLLAQGLSAAEVAQKTGLPLTMVGGLNNIVY
jgi:catechol 2,3-dioxygenase-like lactoylglutathione lyase family enzyme